MDNKSNKNKKKVLIKQQVFVSYKWDFIQNFQTIDEYFLFIRISRSVFVLFKSLYCL